MTSYRVMADFLVTGCVGARLVLCSVFLTRFYLFGRGTGYGDMVCSDVDMGG